MKKLLSVQRSAQRHWVGDGFPVRTLLSYQDPRPSLSPFLLLDYAGPAAFAAASRPRGVGQHPHRGFETVTVVYQGEVEHRDSAGNTGVVGPGDVQWMTAASGVLHEELHSRAFSQKGGTLEMVQLWVNLPARLKMSPPRYQTLLDAQIPVVALPSVAPHTGSGSLRVIAGELQGARGPAQTFTPVNLWDLRLRGGQRVELPLADGHTTALLVLSGVALLDGSARAGAAELAIFDPSGDGIAVQADGDLKALVLSGEPIDEPVVGYGPFVMNTEEEIEQAIVDHQRGLLGRLSP
jgi:redox-sensitive bicupin YhaK (pirin superfamily)